MMMSDVLKEILSATAVAGPAGAAMFALIFAIYSQYVQARDRSRYENKSHQAIISVMRSSYEDRISDLNNRLMATEDRWKEVNHLLMDSQRTQPVRIEDSKVAVNRFLSQLGIGERDTAIDPKLIFVLTPFNERERVTYKTIQEACARYGFRCVRGDEEFSSGEILPHIVELIVECRLVIANISGRNPNVYYELGIAHALGKPTILISRTLDEVPFDVKSKRIVLFNSRAELDQRLRDELLKLLAEGEALGTPI